MSTGRTAPIWRVLAVALVAVAVGSLGFWLEEVGHADDFATVVVVAFIFTVGFWARKRPDRVRASFGPFGRIADATRESLDDIRAFVHDRPLRVGLAISVCYGVAVVAAKAVVVALLGALYSWQLVVAVGAVVGALAAAPEFFRGVVGRLSPPNAVGPKSEEVGTDDDGT